VETLAGVIQTSVVSQSPEYGVRVNMGNPKFAKNDNAQADIAFVSLGNPHVVLFVKALDDVDLDVMGAQYNRQIPGGANVHVVVKAGPSRLLVRHFERGAGRTMACGTGAVACAAAAIARGEVSSPVEVNVPGGRLVVEWDGKGEAFLTGPAVRVFDTTVRA
nr:diaminopimelate epimerase [Candidatus Eremiobacteraeota bacterium]